MRNAKGFTLIELVVVLVILGILAAVAVPRFVDLSSNAEAAAMDGIVGAVESASAINYAACEAGSGDCVAIADGDTCSNFITTGTGGIMQSFDSSYGVSGTVTDSGDGTGTCTITAPAGQSVADGTPTIILTN